ncbi:peptidase S8/S53 subtilisin kexin sedolisin [Trinickia dinghuensis]|uniref:Peptidase S8/S53 subtilisin kexin sedolisin n=2 Tax=Trinickia dinghuensis TaxID=2291023 RepID=A0A3D8K6T0_9BURK|nr:peptidase S8/S53 subtilisin kexin sedolisin [Trinickia dinghuensis]
MLLTAALCGPSAWADPPASGTVLIPDSTVEHPGDVGRKAHTNHLVLLHDKAQSVGTAPSGETPHSITTQVYALPDPSTSGTGSGTIVLVDAYDYPTAESDLNTFSSTFGLPQTCSSGAAQCFNFQRIYASGSQPQLNCGWGQEAALDIEWAHAMAPHANIVLVEAASSSFSDLFAAVDVAVNTIKQSGAGGEVSMSWGGSEFASESFYDSHFNPTGATVVFFASAGDTGGVNIYPSVSPDVVSAGGTTINRSTTGQFLSETGWSGSGGGASKYEPRPAWQKAISRIVGTRRGAPDFSFDADPNSGVSVYDTTSCQGYSGWMVFGGTSVASPSLAGIVNSAGKFHPSSTSELTTIYGNLGNALDFRDITSGKAGSNRAGPGWDFVTGVGSDQGLNGK